MDIQTIFYFAAIIYIILWIVFLLIGIAVLWKVYDTVSHAPEKIESAVSHIIDSNKGQILGMAGMAVVSLFMAKLKERFRK